MQQLQAIKEKDQTVTEGMFASARSYAMSFFVFWDISWLLAGIRKEFFFHPPANLPCVARGTFLLLPQGLAVGSDETPD